jgi:hypothetical protein
MPSNDQRPQKDWLIMLYMAGDNNLDHEMVLSLQFLLEVEKLGNHAIVVEFDSNQPGLPTRRYDFTENKGHRLKDYLEPGMTGETSTGNPETLKAFLNDAEDKYDAQRRILILSGHGSGTTEDFLLRDENADDFLSIDELKQALEDSGYKEGGNKLDIIGMDACYMSMAEVCYELSDHAEILIGAEGIEPEFGWPYSKFLRRAYEELKKVEEDEGATRPLEREEVAIVLVKEYVEHYEAYDTSVDLAAIRLNHLEGLKQDFKELVEALGDQPEKHNKLTSAHWRAQTYKSDQYVDLKDLCDQIDHVDFNTDVEDLAIEIVNRLEDAVLLSGCSGFAYQWSHGLSLYFPWALVSADYVNMRFANDTGWDAFIKDIVEETRRDARYEPKPDTPMSDPRKNELAVQWAKACGKRATRDPFLKRGNEGAIKQQLKVGGKRRALRLIERFEADGFAAGEIVQELSSEVYKVGRYTSRRGRYTSRRGRYTSRRGRYGPVTRYPADREMAIKNFAPVIGVDWWPEAPDVRIAQVRESQDDG